MANRKDILQRAYQIHAANPKFGRRRINKQLRAEFGVGLRDSVVDQITRKYRVETARGVKPTFIDTYPKELPLVDAMRQVGFLEFEIRGVKGSPAKGLGEVIPDTNHPIFREVMNIWMKLRLKDFQQYRSRLEKQGYGGKAVKRLWQKRVLSYYKQKDHPGIGGPSNMGGSYIDNDGKPSPWAVYKKIESKIKADAPVGGLGWGTARATTAGLKKTPQKRTADKLKLRNEVIRIQKQINRLSEQISDAKRVNNKALVDRLDRERRSLLETRNKLSDEL